MNVTPYRKYVHGWLEEEDPGVGYEQHHGASVAWHTSWNLPSCGLLDEIALAEIKNLINDDVMINIKLDKTPQYFFL